MLDPKTGAVNCVTARLHRLPFSAQNEEEKKFLEVFEPQKRSTIHHNYSSAEPQLRHGSRRNGH